MRRWAGVAEAVTRWLAGEEGVCGEILETKGAAGQGGAREVECG